MTKICPECGYEQKDNAKFCSKCGTPFDKIGNNHKPKNKKKLGLAILIIVILIAAVAFYAISCDKVSISRIDSFSMSCYNNESEIYYVYDASGMFTIDSSNKNLSHFTSNFTFYSGNSVVKTVSGELLDYENQYIASTYFTSKELYNIDSVKLDIYNVNGNLIASKEAPFTMGYMGEPIEI